MLHFLTITKMIDYNKINQLLQEGFRNAKGKGSILVYPPLNIGKVLLQISCFEFVNKMGDRIIDGCHEISFHLIEKNSDLRAVTSIGTRGLNAKYYHSFVLDGERVIDLTGNLVMPKNTYYLLNNVKELNNINYEEYLEEKDDSIQFDESNTIFPLLRNALYKQYKDSNE